MIAVANNLHKVNNIRNLFENFMLQQILQKKKYKKILMYKIEIKILNIKVDI